MVVLVVVEVVQVPLIPQTRVQITTSRAGLALALWFPGIAPCNSANLDATHTLW